MKTKVLIFSLFISFLLIIQGCSTKSENFAMSSDRVKINFDKQGEGETALVFVHGWTNNLSIWDAQVSHFSEKYKVVTIDLAGHGKSGNNRDNWTISSFGDDVVGVIKHLNLNKVVLVGFSMGAPVIIETATKIPEFVDGLVLVDDLQNIEMKFSPEMIDHMNSMYMDLVTAPAPEKLEGVFYKKNPDESFERVNSILKDASQIGWKKSLNEYFRWRNEDCIESLMKIKAPIISINSDLSPTNEEAFTMYVPSYKVKIIPDVGHLVMWDAPEVFNRLLEESIQEF